MRYSLIREMDISNGNGIGVSLFVQGCPFRCKGCFNQETWDFNGGKEFDIVTKLKFIELAKNPYIKRISILGGEPLADANAFDVMSLISDIAQACPNKKIWVYTGYKFEDIIDNYKSDNVANIARYLILSMADVLVDGQFELDKQDLYHKEIKFAGSTNQRVIDLKESMRLGQEVLYE